MPSPFPSRWWSSPSGALASTGKLRTGAKSAQSRSTGGGGMQTVGYAASHSWPGCPYAPPGTIVTAAARSLSRFESCSADVPHCASMQPLRLAATRAVSAPGWVTRIVTVIDAELPGARLLISQYATQDFAEQSPIVDVTFVSVFPYEPGRSSTWTP